MARKNLLLDTQDDDLSDEDLRQPTPQAAVVPAPVRAQRGAPGVFSLAIADIAARASAAEEVEAKLTAGQTIIELDAALVDPSFVLDRMMEDDEAFATLRNAIAEQGQDSPILVRPHPTEEGRYQVAFGHRRLRVAKDLGRPVRAVVKKLSDEELVLAQGQENCTRVDLSYIERARFARRLEDLNYRREVIMTALGIDKAAVSKMMSVTGRIPGDVIEAIGPAPSIGRPRWIELADQFKAETVPERLKALMESGVFRTTDSDTRFNQVFDVLAGEADNGTDAPRGKGRGQGAHSDARYWSSPAGEKLVRITYNTRACAMLFDEKSAPGFGDFVATQMERLFADYMAAHAGKDSMSQSGGNSKSSKRVRRPAG